MQEIEQKISPLVESLFPSFYRENGENFVLFVKAYYEWLEENHQLLTLEDNTNFLVGDTVTQQNVTGTIISYVGDDILVRVDGVETFKCFNVCSELIPITSTSGGNTYIERGGTQKRVGPIFFARNLLTLRDIDKTIDLFIVRFKEKYLKNIEFDVQTNKQLLVKHSLDLYRAKGTERAIDLFFRLIYGVKAEVYYPGEDVFRLSEGQWVKPKYLEISSSSVERAITLVGKQIQGVTSGATAFVERYIKRKIKNGFVHVLYISNVKGEFVNAELLKSDKIYSDSPTVVGSLTSVEIVSGSKLFAVGDIVSFNSIRGDYGLARVSEVSNRTGVVDFLLIEGGYGYTVSGNSALSASELEKRTESIVSEKVLTLSNVVQSNTIDQFIITSGGSGYTNSDLLVVRSNYLNAVARIETNGSGAIVKAGIVQSGSGFYSSSPTVLITNSVGGSSTGSSAAITATTKEQTKYFQYFEPLTQRLATIVYTSASNNQLFQNGSSFYISNGSANIAHGTIITNSNGALVDANGQMQLVISNNALFGTGNTIYQNSTVSATISTITNTSATSTVMGVPNTATFSVSDILDGVFERGDEVYQVDSANVETGNAIVTSTSGTLASGSVTVDDLRGVIRQGRTLRARSKLVTANCTDVSVTVGVYNIQNNFTNSYGGQIFTTTTGTIANVQSISSGTGASFKVGTISDSEIVYLNTDLLSQNNQPITGANQAYMSLRLNAAQYGFPKNPSGNSSAIIFSCLNFDSFTIGTIGSLTSINPGSDYNLDPYVLAYQPYISSFNLRNYIFNITGATGSFNVGERIEQAAASETRYTLAIGAETGISVGDKVYQVNTATSAQTANGIVVSITPSTNTVTVNQVQGTFAATTGTAGPLTSATAAQTAIVYNTASNNQLFVNGASVRIATKVDFNGNTSSVLVGNSIAKGFINLGSTNTARYSQNDLVQYKVPTGNTALGGLANGSIYKIIVSNATHIQLANIETSTAVNISSVPTDSEIHSIIRYNSNAAIITNANNTLANANGVLTVAITSGSLLTSDTIIDSSNTNVTANVVSFSNTGLATPILSVSTTSVNITAKGIVISGNSSVLYVKRTQFDNYFQDGQTITGGQSGVTATIQSVVQDPDVLPIGLNALIEANVVTANGSITSLQVVDSGVGYSNGEIMLYTSEDGLRAGEAKAIVSGMGTGSGYYKTSKGFLSSLSKIHDGDYYQEYSYEILSRIPLDKYGDMFKRVMHTAGTKFFGAVLLEDLANTTVEIANSEVVTLLSNTKQFNSNSNISSNAIFFNNTYPNNQIVFQTGTKVTYYTASGNSVVIPLANNTNYYITDANTTSVKLQTNPRQITHSFDPTLISSNFIAIPRHNFQNNDCVLYLKAAGNTAVTGITNNSVYHVVSANTTGVKLSLTRGGGAISITTGTVSETGHTLNITTINIQANGTASGAQTNGHYLDILNEI